MIYKLLNQYDPILRKKAEDITIFDAEIKEIGISLYETLLQHQAYGLAAPQVGISKRIIALMFEPFIMYNPIIIGSTDNIIAETEGCLSFPGLYFDVNRKQEITIEWQTETGEKKSNTFSNLESVALQHEIDHLNGVLFIDHISKLKLSIAKKRMKKS